MGKSAAVCKVEWAGVFAKKSAPWGALIFSLDKFPLIAGQLQSEVYLT